MLALTHLVFALLLISVFRLDRSNAFAVLLFGVLIDLDHTFGFVEFLAREGLSNSLDYKAAMASNIQWKSMFHSPEAALLIMPLSVNYRYGIPFVAWAAHIAMDHVQINYLGVMSSIEFLFLGMLLAALACSEIRGMRKNVPSASFSDMLAWEADRTRTWFGELPVLGSLIRYLGPRESLS